MGKSICDPNPIVRIAKFSLGLASVAGSAHLENPDFGDPLKTDQNNVAFYFIGFSPESDSFCLYS